MRSINIIAALIIAGGLSSCSQSDNSDSQMTPVDYKAYDRYYYVGSSPANDTTLFFWTNTKTAFDSLFRILMIQDSTDTIPRADLATKNVLSMVKVTHNLYQINVVSVMLNKRELFVKFNRVMTDSNMTSRVKQSDIITTSADFDNVRFDENGTTTGEVDHTTGN